MTTEEIRLRIGNPARAMPITGHAQLEPTTTFNGIISN